MATTNLIRFGSNLANASPAPSDMWLPVYGGEVITAFQEYNQFLDKVNYKTITSGTTMKFPATWKIGSEYHEAGTELLGLDVETKEYSISLDDRPLVAHFEVDDIDTAMAHFDVRNEIATETGRELARQMDRKIAALLINAARTTTDTGTNSFPVGGNTLLYGGATTGTSDFNSADWGTEANAAALIEWKICQEMDENDVPVNDRCAVVNVPLYYALRKMGLPFSNGGTPSYGTASANVGTLWGRNDTGTAGPRLQDTQGYQLPIDVMGIPVYCSNHLPNTTISTGPAKYQNTFGKSGGVVFQKSAIAVLQMMGVQSEKFRDVRRQSDFMVSKMLMGGGALRPYCAYEILDD
jgi:hypothetical protein